jgi:EAL and modified HD-GYP domain-containing signal transduction protein
LTNPQSAIRDPQSPEPGSHIFIARQPIFRTNQKIYGYELLFRSSLENFFSAAQDGDQATSRVITNSYLLIGINKLTEGHKAFINFTGELLLKEYPALLPRESTVVEVLESVVPTPEIVAACAALVRKGYLLALDDFSYDPSWLPLIRLAQIIKFDISIMGRADLARQVQTVRRERPLKLLAERVETMADFEECKAMGFDLFQGYFFSKPKIIRGRDIPGDKLRYLRILRELQLENYNFARIGTLIASDPSLSYKLLKYVNSSYFAPRQEIVSLHGAVAMLGETNLRKWLYLMMLSYMAQDKPPELLRLCVIRARFCELMGERLDRKGALTGKYYMVGMFSLLDAILDQPMETILEGIAFSAEVKEVLLGKRKTGPLFYAIIFTRAYEKGKWGMVSKLIDILKIDTDELPLLYDEALTFARQFDIGE